MSRPSTPPARTRRRTGPIAALALAAMVGAGCTPARGDDDSDSAPPSTLAVPEVTEPPERQTPFCQIMLDLDESIPADPTIDVTDEVLVAYREALPVAPPEISAELEAVIIGLETDTDPTLPPTATQPPTSDPLDLAAAGSADPDDTSATSVPDDTTTAPPTDDTFVPPSAGTTPGATVESISPEEAFPEEGYIPDDNPAVRLNEFVDFTCRDNVNNPGPPATQPSATPVPPTDES